MAKHALLLFTTTWLLSVYAYDVHKHMTIEELRSTFHVDRHDLVPEYDVVQIHEVKRSKRSIQSAQENSILDSTSANDRRKVDKYNTDTGSYSAKSADDRTSLKLSAFGKQLHLNLVPNQGLFKKGGLKIWTIEPNATSQHGVEYIEHPAETNEHIGDIYQDEANQAAILLRNDAANGALIVEGSIGSDLVIRPLPQRLISHATKQYHSVEADKNKLDKNETLPLVDDEMFLDAEENLSDEVAVDTGFPIKQTFPKTPAHQHIVYKRKQAVQEDAYSDYAFMEPDHLGKRYKRSGHSATDISRSKREAPYTIYPEILVIVDYDGYRLHGGDNLQIKRYFVSFWNGVDLRYKLLKGPKIRISIAGIIVSRGRDATPYLERNRVGRDAIDSAAALTDMGKYLFRERRLPVYDIAVAITKYDMCRRRKGGRCTKGTAGFAYVGGACVINKRLEKVNSVAIIEDTGGFSGIIVAAHEVGHLLGAVHDGSPPPSYLGGPGAQKCQWEDGYIMSDLRHTERGFRWSPCSVASFHHFLNGDTASCLYNPPHEDDSLPRVLPGKLLTLDAQCRRDRGTSACFKDDRVCAQLFCFDAGSGYCVAYRPAAEGSSCGDGQYCLNGRCVAEHENIIPDYSQNTPAYVRQDGSTSSGRALSFNEGGNYNSNRASTPVQQDSPHVSYRPFQYQNPNPSSQRTTFPSSTYRSFPSFSVSNTKSPYDFQHFTNRPVTQIYDNLHSTKVTVATISSTLNPYIGNYYELRQRTTKNPYNFADFGRHFKNTNIENDDNLNKNYLKRSYVSDNFFMESNNSKNITETVAG